MCRAVSTLLLDFIVACFQHACFAGGRYTPHCASLRYASVGLLRYRASGTLDGARCLQQRRPDFNQRVGTQLFSASKR